MTVTSDLARVQYSGNGTTTVFSTGFSFLSNLDVGVVLTDTTTLVETAQIENADYALAGSSHADDPPISGVLTMAVAPPVGTVLTIYRDVQFVQDLDGTTLSTMDAGDQEEAYDKIWHALAQLKNGLGRTIHAAEGAIDPIPGSWVPMLAVVVDGSRDVVQVTGWINGPVDEPTPQTGMYLGPTGYVTNIADATDIRGPIGPQGVVGPVGPTGPAGARGPAGPSGPGGSGAGDMLRVLNLSDLTDVVAARANLGLGDLAVGDIGDIVIVSPTAPVGAPDNALWWESDVGVLYIRYNDGTSTQWVVASPQPSLTASDIANTPAGGIAASTVQAAINELDTEKAPLASPVLTGDPQAPTAAPGDNDTSIATTAFVANAVLSASPIAVPVQFFTALGSATVTVPAGARKAKVTLVGGGAGCAGGVVTSGGGGTVIKLLTGLTPGNTLALVIGAGGTIAPTPGGDTTLASGTQIITTLVAGGGPTAHASPYGGTASGGDLNIRGFAFGSSLWGIGGTPAEVSGGLGIEPKPGVGYGAGGAAGLPGTGGLAIFEWYP